jgi:hypothetical protein
LASAKEACLGLRHFCSRPETVDIHAWIFLQPNDMHNGCPPSHTSLFLQHQHNQWP